MPEPLFDPSWFRVAAVKPRLRAHVQVHRHHYRGALWYVLQDNTTGRFHRFTPAAHQVIGLMDGERTVDDIWKLAVQRLGDDAPTQAETIRLLYQLHASDVLQSDIPPDVDELLRRYDEQRRAKWKQSFKSPLAIRIPLLDPERFLNLTLPVAGPLFGWFGAIVWLLVMGYAAVVLGLHWPELTQNVTERALAPQNLFVIWLVFPVVKVLHELGHAYAVKKWGGEVHQMGIMLLVLTPVPYVDASAASAFRSRGQRALVGAAGMLVEGFVAAVALIVWAEVEPGMVRIICFNIMLIAGVSTLLFNGNPLLRFDAYYVFADYLEIPNLAARANRYFFYLVQRYGFGAAQVESPAHGRGERGWFLFYAVASFVYRMFIYVAITTFVASKFFFIGLILAAWASYSMLIGPLVKGVRFLFTSSVLRRHRRRAWAVTGAVVVSLLGLVLALPVPLATRTEGVLWVPDQALVRAGADGFVASLVATPGSRVSTGDLVLEIQDPLLPHEVRILRHERAALEARYTYFVHEDRVQAEITREELARNTAQLERAAAELDSLRVISPADGILVLPQARDLEGRFVRQGQELAYVVDPARVTVRAVVVQSDIDLVRSRTRRVELRFASAMDKVQVASVSQEVPSAVRELPSPALGTQGGGAIAIDPSDPSGKTAFSDVFQFDLAVPGGISRASIGDRVHVRFDHGREPMAKRWYRALRQLLLSEFDV